VEIHSTISCSILQFIFRFGNIFQIKIKRGMVWSRELYPDNFLLNTHYSPSELYIAAIDLVRESASSKAHLVNLLHDLAPRNNWFIICVYVSLLWQPSTLLPLMLLLRKCCREVGCKMFGYLGFLN
jgi:hypothetical protein